MKSQKKGNKQYEMNIQARLKKGFQFTAIIASAAVVIAIMVMIGIANRYSYALNKYGFAQGDIGKVMIVFSEARSCTRGMIGYTDPDIVKSLSDTHDTKKESFEKYWSDAGKAIVSAEEKKIYKAINDKIDDYWALDAKISEKGANAKDPDTQKEAEKEAVENLEPAFQEIYADMVKLMDIKVTEGQALSKLMFKISFGAIVIVIIAIVGTYLTSVRLGKQVADGISNPLKELQKRLSAFAQGDLHSEFPVVDSGDEIADMVSVAGGMAADLRSIIKDSDHILGQMAEGDYTVKSDVQDKYNGDFSGLLEAMQKMKHQMNDVMGKINEASSLVSSGSGNLAEAAQEMAEGATDQSAAIEELQATFADITSGVEKTSEKLNETYHTAQQYAAEADKSQAEMQGMVEAINRINETSQKIESIISEIEDIASQTNLLSLNAAIEAARAGEAGKGFAVVADQIRSLSEQSAQAAVNTRGLIENSIEVVKEGNDAAERVSVSMEKVIGGMKEVADSAQELSEIANEQAKAMEQAEQGINQISEVVQTNSATAQETSATSEELSAQAITMNDLISRFHLEE